MREEMPNQLGGAKGAEGLGDLKRRLEENKAVKAPPIEGSPDNKSRRGAGRRVTGVADSVLADRFERNMRIEEATRDTMRVGGKRVELNDVDAMRRAAERGINVSRTPKPPPPVEEPAAVSGVGISEAGPTLPLPEDASRIETQKSAEELKAVLEAARKELVEADKHKDVSAEAMLDYPQTLARYEKARAEYVGSEVGRYILEQTEFLKQRAEREPAKLEWARKGWKKLGKMRLANVWEKAKKVEESGKLGFFASRAANARTVTSGILLGLAAGLPAVALPILTLRAGMAAAGAGFGTYEIMEKRRLTKIASISEKELQEMPTETVKERLLQLSAFAHVSGSWENVRDAFDKLKGKYENDLTEAITQGATLKDYMEGEVARSMTILGAKLGEEKKSKKTRLWTAAGAGALAGVGVPLIRKLLGWGEVAKTAVTPQPMESEVAYAEKVLSEMDKTGATASIPGEELRMPGAAPGADFQAENFNAASRLVRESLETAEEFKITFQPGEGPIHEARKALALYIAQVGEKNPALRDLIPAQKIWAEERLWKLTQTQLKEVGALKDIYHPGDSIAFSRNNVEKVLSELKDKFGTPEKITRLNENLKDFTGRVNWNRYVVRGGYGVWGLDNGIKIRIPKQVLAEATADPRMGERVLDNMLKELKEHPDITVPGEEYEASSQVINFHPNLEKLSEGPDVAGGGKIDLTPMPEEVGKWRESFFVHYSGLRKEYYDAIKNLSVSEFLKKRMFPLSPDQQFPYPQVDSEYPWIRQTKIAHNRSMNLVRLQQKLRWSIGHYVAPDEQAEIGNMSVEEYLRKIILQGK